MLFPPQVQLLRNVSLWTDYFFRWNLSSGNFLPAPLPPFSDGINHSGYALPQQGLKHERINADFSVHAMVTADSYWESAYKRLISEKLVLEAQLTSLQDNLTPNSCKDIATEENDEDKTLNNDESKAHNLEEIDLYLESIKVDGEKNLFTEE